MNAYLKGPAPERPTGVSVGDHSNDRQAVPLLKSGTSSDKPIYSSQNLFGSTNEIGIEHQGFFYRLRITRQGKLILNK